MTVQDAHSHVLDELGVQKTWGRALFDMARGQPLGTVGALVVLVMVPKVDGLRKATGQTVYADDLNLPRMLYGKLLGSRRPHARIVSIDVSKAEALPGALP